MPTRMDIAMRIRKWAKLMERYERKQYLDAAEVKASEKIRKEMNEFADGIWK